MKKDTLLLLKQIEKELKLGIIIIDVLITLYVLWLIITNTSTWIIGILFGFTPFGAYELFKADALFKFCITHKLMIIHILCVYTCCVYQAYVGFGDILYCMRWIMFILGLLLLTNIIYKIWAN